VLERKARIRTGEKEGNRDWGEYGLEGGREYELERMRRKKLENKGNSKGVIRLDRTKEMCILEKEGNRDPR
jgi:hypothetical protein